MQYAVQYVKVAYFHEIDNLKKQKKIKKYVFTESGRIDPWNQFY